MSDDDLYYTFLFYNFIGVEEMRIHLMLNEFESIVYNVCYDIEWIFYNY